MGFARLNHLRFIACDPLLPVPALFGLPPRLEPICPKAKKGR